MLRGKERKEIWVIRWESVFQLPNFLSLNLGLEEEEE